MRTMVGLNTPSSGRALIAGRPYRELREPLRMVGAVLDGNGFHPARTARSHLGYLAAANRLPEKRVHEVLGLTGLDGVAGRRVGRFSLGMKQRLAIAAALLGDPQILILDEPNNGLDPEGIIWLRGLLTDLAAEGRTVLVSSHLITEVALSAGHLARDRPRSPARRRSHRGPGPPGRHHPRGDLPAADPRHGRVRQRTADGRSPMRRTALLRSELLKLRSIPSTYVVIVAAVGVGLGVGVLEMTSTSHHWLQLDPQDRARFDPVADSFSGFQFAELAFGALGVLAITTEYATGTMAATLVASPQRTQVYAAKLAALILVVAPICVASTFAAFILGQRAIADRHLDVALSDPHVLRAVIGAALYMVVVTLVGFGLGAVIRHTAGALTVMFALVFLAWPVARAVESFSYLPDRWLLVNAADALVSIHPPTGPNALRTPSLAMACLELGTYVVVLLAAGAWRANRDL